jgi:hypothetical protein
MNKTKLTFPCILAVFFVSLILGPSLSSSALYKWVDKKGQVHISDFHPGSDEMADEPTTVPTEKPAAEPQVPKESPQQPVVEEKREASVAQQLPQQKPQPAPEAQQPPQQKPQPAPEVKQASVPDTSKPQMPLFPKDFPKFPTGKFPGDAKGVIPGIVAMMGAFFLIIVIISVAFYLLFAACLYFIAKKLGAPAPWLAWIPLVQIWTFVVAAKGTDGQPVLWIIGLIIPIVSFFVGIYLWMCITENMGKNKWLALLTLLPIVNLIFIVWLATLKSPLTSSGEMFQAG